MQSWLKSQQTKAVAGGLMALVKMAELWSGLRDKVTIKKPISSLFKLKFFFFLFKGFAPVQFPAGTSGNQVVLVNSFNSYDCQIHPDKTTTTQITCYTS